MKTKKVSLMKGFSMPLFAAICAAAAFCTALAEPPPDLTPEQRKKVLEMNRRVFGGFVTKPDPGNGYIVVVNQQKRVSDKDLMRAVRYMKRYSSLPIEFKAVPDPKAAVTVYVKDDASQTASLLVSPGEFWAQVNVAALAGDKPGDGVLALRTRKELARGLAYACGGGGSQYKDSLAGPIRSLRQLDRFDDEGLPPDVFLRMGVFAGALGVRPVYRASYAAACQEGWAPPPTNEYQKAIWDQVHALPTEPMKIKPETKKVSD